MELLAALRDRRPGIKCTVRLALIEEVIADLESFRADIGIVGRDCASDTIHSVFYNRHRSFVVVNRSHRLAGRQTIRMKELAGEPMIIRTSSSTTQGSLRQGRGLRRYRGRSRIRDRKPGRPAPKRLCAAWGSGLSRKRNSRRIPNFTPLTVTDAKNVHPRLYRLPESAPKQAPDPRISLACRVYRRGERQLGRKRYNQNDLYARAYRSDARAGGAFLKLRFPVNDEQAGAENYRRPEPCPQNR